MKHVPTLAGTPVGLAVGVGDGDTLGAVAGAVDPGTVVDYVAEVQGAVPLVPGSEDDCCARLVRRLGYERRDVSRTWLTFLRGLDLAVETDEGFRRTRTEPSLDGLRAGLLDGVVGAREIAERAVGGDTDDSAAAAETAERTAGGATTVEAAFDAVEPLVPRWERTRTDDWEEVWRERVVRLCDWLAALGLLDADAGESSGEPTYVATAATHAALES